MDRAESHLSLGILAENQNFSAEAEKHYRNAIIRDDLFVPARMNLATLLSGQGEVQRLSSYFAKRSAYSQLGADSLFSWAFVGRKPGKVARGHSFIGACGWLLAREPRVNYNLGIAYWQSNRLDDALRSFDQSIRLQPDNPEFRQRISELYAQQGRWAEALPHLKRLNELVPGNPQINAFLDEAQQRVLAPKN